MLFKPMVMNNLYNQVKSYLRINTDLEERRYGFKDACSRLVELDETIHPAGLLGGDAVGFGVEPFDFAGNAGIKAGGVKEGDGPDARFPRKKVIPAFGDVAAERRQRRETGYNNAFTAHNSLMKQKVVERLMI